MNRGLRNNIERKAGRTVTEPGEQKTNRGFGNSLVYKKYGDKTTLCIDMGQNKK